MVICTAALAMGLQTAALRRVGQVAVATTYGTGAIVRLGEKVALAVRRVEHTSGTRRRVTIGVLSAVLVGYVAGAVLATVLGGSPWLLMLPAVALVGLAAISGLAVRQGSAGVG